MKFCLESLTGRNHLGNIGIDGSVMLNWFLGGT